MYTAWFNHLCVELPSSEPIVEDLIATEMVPIVIEQLRDLLYINSIIEGCGISNLPFVGRHLHRE